MVWGREYGRARKSHRFVWCGVQYSRARKSHRFVWCEVQYSRARSHRFVWCGVEYGIEPGRAIDLYGVGYSTVEPGRYGIRLLVHC